MCRDVKGIEVSRRQHEAVAIHTEFVRQQFRMTGPVMPARLHRLFVQRRGDDAVKLAGAGKRARAHHVSGRGIARLCADRSVRELSHRRTLLHDLQQVRIVGRLRRRAHRDKGGGIAAN